MFLCPSSLSNVTVNHFWRIKRLFLIVAEVKRYCRESTGFGDCLIKTGVSIPFLPLCLQRSGLISEASNSSLVNWEKSTYIINTVPRHMIFTSFPCSQTTTKTLKKTVDTGWTENMILFKFQCWPGMSSSLPQATIMSAVQGHELTEESWRK